MGKSMIHIQPIKVNSEIHNFRKNKMNHVREDLSDDNFSWVEINTKDSRRELESLVKEKTGRRMQKKATPLREGVFLIEQKHTNKEVLQIVKDVEKKFGIKAIQLHIHRDEGHWANLEDPTKKTVWLPNLHAHVVFEWVDRNTGKSFKLNRDDMSELQTYFANRLDMYRGITSSTTHLNAQEWKLKKKREEAVKLNAKVSEIEKKASKIITEKKKAKLFDELLKKDPEFKKMLDKYIEPKKQRKKGKKM